MTAPERPGPERPGPDYPPEWDAEPVAQDRCTCLPYPYGDGPEIDCPEHGATDEDRALMSHESHRVWVEGCADCVDRANWLEAQR